MRGYKNMIAERLLLCCLVIDISVYMRTKFNLIHNTKGVKKLVKHLTPESLR